MRLSRNIYEVYFAFSICLMKASAVASSLNLAPYLSTCTNLLASFFSRVSPVILATRGSPGMALPRRLKICSLSW